MIRKELDEVIGKHMTAMREEIERRRPAHVHVDIDENVEAFRTSVQVSIILQGQASAWQKVLLGIGKAFILLTGLKPLYLYSKHVGFK